MAATHHHTVQGPAGGREGVGHIRLCKPTLVGIVAEAELAINVMSGRPNVVITYKHTKARPGCYGRRMSVFRQCKQISGGIVAEAQLAIIVISGRPNVSKAQ
jgi:hypothetical protein